MPVEARIAEHLYRWTSWDIVKPPDGEKTVTYKVHYSW
jgi:hypothetical protein